MMDKVKNKGTVVLLAAIGINVLNGILYTWSAISKSLISDWNWTSKQASLPYTVYSIFFVLAMVIFGGLQDSKGPRLIATIGSIFLGMGLMLSGLTQSPIMYIITIGILVGSGVGMHTVTTAPSAIKWFASDKKGVITGIVSAGVGVSSLIYAPLGSFLLLTVGINRTFIYMGLGVLIFTTLLSQLLATPIEKHAKLENALEAEVDYNWRFMIGDKKFYKLWFMEAFAASAGLMIIGHIATIAKIQANWENAFVLVMILSIFNTIGRIAGGALSDKIGRINLMRITFMLQGVNMALFYNYINVPTMILGVSIAGFCYGSIFSVFPATISDYYGSKNFGLNYGIMFTAWGFGGVIGPMTGAIIFDATGNYTMAYIIALGLLVISTLITFTFKKVIK